MLGYTAASLAMIFNVAGQVILSGVLRRATLHTQDGKRWDGIKFLLHDPLFWLGSMFAAAMLLTWAFALSQLPLNRILPIMALVFLFSPLVAWQIYGERLNLMNISGFLLLTAGIILSGWK